MLRDALNVAPFNRGSGPEAPSMIWLPSTVRIPLHVRVHGLAPREILLEANAMEGALIVMEAFDSNLAAAVTSRV